MRQEHTRPRPVGAISVFLVLFAFSAVTAHALRVSDIEARPSLFWIGNGYTVDSSGAPVQGSDVSPLAGGAGVGFGLEFSPLVSLRPSLDLFGIQYRMTTIGKVVPTQIESNDALLMLNALVAVPITFTFHLSPVLTLSAGVSPSLLFRIPTIGYGSPDRAAITAYMYSSVRFFYPEAQLSLSYLFTPKVHFGVGLRTLFPIFHIWDGEQVPFWDQMIAGGTLFVRFPL